jgi:hypothetical protein
MGGGTACVPSRLDGALHRTTRPGTAWRHPPWWATAGPAWGPPRPSCPPREQYVTPALALSLPPVGLDVIAWVASSGGYTRGEIKPRVAQACTVPVATPRRRAARPPPRPPPCVQPVAPLWECHGGRPRLTPRRGTAQAHSAFPWAYRRWKPVNGARRVRSRAPHPHTVVCSLVSLYAKSLHTRFRHLMSRTHCYYALPCAASVPMLWGSI